MTKEKTEVERQPLPDWPGWMSPEVAARYLDSSVHTLNDWRTRGTGPSFKRVGQRFVRYRKEDLDSWMEARG